MGGPIPAGIDVLRVTGSACVPTHRLIDAELMRNGKPVARSRTAPPDARGGVDARLGLPAAAAHLQPDGELRLSG